MVVVWSHSTQCGAIDKTNGFEVQICLIFTPKIGEDSHFASYFSNGLKPPTRIGLGMKKGWMD